MLTLNTQQLWAGVQSTGTSTREGAAAALYRDVVPQQQKLPQEVIPPSTVNTRSRKPLLQYIPKIVLSYFVLLDIYFCQWRFPPFHLDRYVPSERLHHSSLMEVMIIEDSGGQMFVTVS